MLLDCWNVATWFCLVFECWLLLWWFRCGVLVCYLLIIRCGWVIWLAVGLCWLVLLCMICLIVLFDSIVFASIGCYWIGIVCWIVICGLFVWFNSVAI